jgi:hypothetical protein
LGKAEADTEAETAETAETETARYPRVHKIQQSCLIVADQNDILLPAVLSLRQNPPRRLRMRPLLLPLLDHESSDIRANDTGHINARRQLVHCSRIPQVFFQLDLTEFASWD